MTHWWLMMRKNLPIRPQTDLTFPDSDTMFHGIAVFLFYIEMPEFYDQTFVFLPMLTGYFTKNDLHSVFCYGIMNLNYNLVTTNREKE